MAYAPDRLTLVKNVGGLTGMKVWLLDTLDATAAVDSAGYISDAKARGMEKGDLVIVRIWPSAFPTNAEKITPDGTAIDMTSLGFHWVIGISATTGAADLTDTLAVTATNTD